jgi:hypothetical protein
MENHQEELKAHLMATSDEFRSLAEHHAQLKKQLEAIESKPRLTIEDEENERNCVGKTIPQKALIHTDNRKVAMEVGIL